MTNNQLTRKRLEKIKSWRETYGAGSNVMLPTEEAEELARIALAAMDSEPVLYCVGGAYLDLNTISTCKDAVDSWVDEWNQERMPGEAEYQTVPLYRHAQPVVPDAAAVYAQLSDHEKWSTSLENVNHVLNAFRAAMLAAAPQEVK
ncbi:valyl-tRNA synthetase [Klebsiella oxytoca]|uniref:valyl-tRNA synthetase n=1 Tax=Klebsiella oxytoca TaxID=571 RepID=UPI0025992FFF|nr:valyl-tRNA synthetase [Klebsiella oxytoca]MDM4094057.1 valyl-tRNA synthetase [Klebsiella oxytoca]